MLTIRGGGSESTVNPPDPPDPPDVYRRYCACDAQLQLTFSLALVAVPINTVFGISVAMLIARNEFRGKVSQHLRLGIV